MHKIFKIPREQLTAFNQLITTIKHLPRINIKINGMADFWQITLEGPEDDLQEFIEVLQQNGYNI